MSNILERFKNIETVVCDVDGVFTNGNLLVTENGEMLRTMSVRDGYVVKKSVNSGINIIIITGGNSLGVKKRFEDLGVIEYHAAIKDKLCLYRKMIADGRIPNNDTTIYIGDDVPDLPVILEVGLSCCPKDAIPEIKKVADYISPYKGGEGCIRDILEKILKLKGKWL